MAVSSIVINYRLGQSPFNNLVKGVVNTLLKTINYFPPQFFKARNIIENKHATRATVPRVLHYNAEIVVISHN